jgi:hypothetical protein
MRKASRGGGRIGGEDGFAGAFGATVTITRPQGMGLCFVATDGPAAEAAVAAAGGRPVTRFPGGDRCLALLTWAGLEALRGHPSVRAAGPVSVDPERFERFAALAGLNPSSQTAPDRAQGG